MASVSRLVAAISEATDETKEAVNAYARALIDAGLLPKSSGRAVAQIEMVHFVRLITAVALKPKIKDVAKMTASYLSLPIAGRTLEGKFVSGSKTAEDGLVSLCSLILSDDNSNDAIALRKLLCEGEVQFVLNFPLVEIKYPRDLIGEEIVRFKPVGERGDLDRAHIRRSVIVSASLVTLVAIKIDPENWHSVFGEAS